MLYVRAVSPWKPVFNNTACICMKNKQRCGAGLCNHAGYVIVAVKAKSTIFVVKQMKKQSFEDMFPADRACVCLVVTEYECLTKQKPLLSVLIRF